VNDPAVSAAPAAALFPLLEALPVAVVLIDGEEIVGWNQAAEVLYGYPAAEALGRPVLEVLFDPDDRAGAARTLAAAGDGDGQRWEGDFRVCRRDGVLLVSSFRAVPAGRGRHGGVLLAWIAADRMDQGLAEQERAVLLSAEHAARATAEEALGLVEAVVGSAPVGIAVFDLELRYVRVNAALADISGVPAEEHLGHYVGEVVPLPPEVGADLRRVVTTGRTILGRDVMLEAGNGGPRYFRADYYPVLTSAGVLMGAGATIIEVTAARRAEQERGELLARAEAAQKRLAILATASTVLTTTMEVDELLSRLARVLAPGSADWCIIELIGADGRLEYAAVSHRDRSRANDLRAAIMAYPVDRQGDGPVAHVLRTGQGQLFRPDQMRSTMEAAAADHRRPELMAGFDLRSSVIVPIQARRETFGVLVMSTEGDDVLTDEDLDLAVEIAHRAALALGNALAYQRDHELAENLQRGLLPVTLPTVAGLEVAVRYLAATAGVLVGGDWYDVIAFHEGPAAVVIGDVLGHDIEASSAMGQLRTGLRAYAYEDHRDPAEVLVRLDRLMEQLNVPMATCVLALIDVDRLTLRWSSAGHPQPLLLRHGQARYLEGGSGVLLGIHDAPERESATIDLQPGDTLVLFTDGLFERRGEPLTDGLARLAVVAAGLRTADPEKLCQGIVDELLPPGEGRSDDMAILVARVAPVAPVAGASMGTAPGER
jgi:PAS domain S-box-containing protein